jgi:hypothetical protein
MIPVLLAMAGLPTALTIAQQRPGRQRQADAARSKQPSQDAPRFGQLPIYYVVRPMDLAVLEADSEKVPAGVPIRCEVRTPPGGESGVQILYLAANGASVKKGDLFIEFDSSAECPTRPSLAAKGASERD